MAPAIREKKAKKISLQADTTREKNWLTTLFKKAKELSILTDSKIAIVLHSSTGKLHEFVSDNHTMKDILESSLRDLEEKPKKAVKAKPLRLEGNGNGNGMLPTEDSGMPPLEDHTPENTPDDSAHEKQLTKSAMHKMLDSCTNEEMEHFELQLKQAMIRLLKGKASMVEEQVKDKTKKFLSGASDWEEIQFEVGSTSPTMEFMSPSRARDSQEIRFEIGSTSRTEVESSSRARDRETIWFDIGSTSRIMEVGSSSSSSGPKESVEFQDNMELDLELSLGPSRWR